MWLCFTAAFRWRATPQVVLRYDAGQLIRVPRACARAALAAGKALPAVNPKARKRACPEPPLGKASGPS